MPCDARNHRPIQCGQSPIQRVIGLCANTPTNEVTHQHRHQGHRQSGSCRHRPGLGVRQRREHSPLLGLQRKYRQKRQGDDTEREKQRRADLLSRVGHTLPVTALIPACQVMVQVLDHHDGAIHHGTDCNRNPPQGHDVGVESLTTHDEQRNQNADRQADDSDQR